jgi:hypothetical protein
LITLTADALKQQKERSWRNRHTNLDDFRRIVDERLTWNISFKSAEDIEAAAQSCNDTIQRAGCNGTPEHKRTLKACDCPRLIKKYEEYVKDGTDYEYPQARDYLIQLNRNSKNSSLTLKWQHVSIPARESTEYSLWKATIRLKYVENILR